MKRVFLILLSVALLGALITIPAMAADGGTAAVSNATGASGETVKLRLSLSGFADADAIRVTVTYDQGLTWDKDASDWMIAGALDGIGYNNTNVAVWAADTGVLADVNKDILELAFTLPEPAQGQTDFAYDVKCEVLVKAGDTVLGTVEAAGTVTLWNPAQTVILNKNTLTLDINGTNTETLVASVLPANNTEKAAWSSDNTEIAEVTAEGKVTVKKVGTANITVTAGNATNTCVVTAICSHTLTEHPAVTPNCLSTGNNKYYTCDICNAVLKADKVTKTTVEAEMLEKTGCAGGTATCTKKAVCATCGKEYGELLDHDYDTAWLSDTANHWHKCKNCTATTTPAAHTYEWVLDKAATEDATGVKHEQCACGAKRSEDTQIPKLDHKHIGITHHAAVKATCAKTGTLEHWTCSSSKCAGKYYGDKACQLELKSIQEAVNKDNHAGGTELKNVLEATCSEAGFSGDTHCLGCKALVKQGAVVPATGKHTPKDGYLSDANSHWQICSHCAAVVDSTKAAHSYKWVVDKKPTETATGVKHQQCACGYKTAENTVADKLKHTPKLVAGKAPTCTEAGVLEHFYCANCGGYYAAAEGKAGDKITKDSITLAATGHSFDEAWSSDESSHFHVCACGETADKAEHTTEVVNAKEATATETGYTGDTVCTVCQYVVSQGEEIPVVETQAPTEPAQTEPAGTDGDDGTVSPAVWIVPVAVAAAVAIIIPIWKKRKI